MTEIPEAFTMFKEIIMIAVDITILDVTDFLLSRVILMVINLKVLDVRTLISCDNCSEESGVCLF